MGEPRPESASERLNRFAHEIASQMFLPNVRRVAVERACALTEGDGATLFVLDAQSGELSFQIVEGEKGEHLAERRLQKGQGIAGRVAQSRDSALVPDVKTAPDFANAFDQQSGFITASIIAVPVVFAGEVLGVLEVVRGPSRPAFTGAELGWLEAFAPHVAAAVQHANTEAALREAKDKLLAEAADLEARVQERTNQIARGKKEWEGTFDAIQAPIAVLDGFTVRRANLEYLRRTGLTWQQLIGKKCHQVLAGRDSPCLGCPLLAAHNVPKDVQIASQVFQAASYPMTPDDPNSPVVLSYRDVTDARRMAEKLRASERLVAVGQLASGAAHEINNPLAFVDANLRHLRDLVEDGELGKEDIDEAREVVVEGLSGVRRIADIVKGLRELSRQEQGVVEATSVNTAVSRSVRTVLGEQTAVGLSLEASGMIAAAPLQLAQAIEHVVRNARQAVESDEHISIRTFDTIDSVVVEVRDRGVGIPEQHLSHVFEPFFTTRKVGEGTGLGLTATWGIVKSHGGDVRLDSRVGEGTTVTFTFPRASAKVVADLASGSRLRSVSAGRYTERAAS